MTPVEVGLRVIRGPDWSWGDQDGGEGGVGTVVEVRRAADPEGTAYVQWDGGHRSNYRVGHQGRHDLRTLDGAPCGVRHPVEVVCHGCGDAGFFGLRWKCSECANLDLCGRCYGEGRHDLGHRFRRYDCASSGGTYLAPPRSETFFMPSLRLYL